MARYRDAKCRLCRREGHEALPEGRPLLHRQVRDRAAQLSAGPARPATAASSPPYGVQLREKQKAKRIYGVLESQFRKYFQWAESREGRHRREPAPAPRAAPRQRGVPARLRGLAPGGAADGGARPLPGERPQGDGAVVPGEGRRRGPAAAHVEDAGAHRRQRQRRSRPGAAVARARRRTRRRASSGACRCATTSRSRSPSSSSSSCTASKETGAHATDSVPEAEEGRVGDSERPVRPARRRALREGLRADRRQLAPAHAAVDRARRGRVLGADRRRQERRDADSGRDREHDRRLAQSEEAGDPGARRASPGAPAGGQRPEGRDGRGRSGDGRRGREPRGPPVHHRVRARG